MIADVPISSQVLQATPHIVRHTLLGLYPVVPGHQLTDCQSKNLTHIQTVGEILGVCGGSTVHVTLEDLEQSFSSVCFAIHRLLWIAQQIIVRTRGRCVHRAQQQGSSSARCRLPIFSEPTTSAVNNIKANQGGAKPRSAVRQVSLQHFAVTSMVCEAPSQVPFQSRLRDAFNS